MTKYTPKPGMVEATSFGGNWIREDRCKCRVAGINPDAVPRLVEALSWSLDVLNKIDERHRGLVMKMLNEHGEERRTQARAAIAKAQGDQ